MTVKQLIQENEKRIAHPSGPGWVSYEETQPTPDKMTSVAINVETNKKPQRLTKQGSFSDYELSDNEENYAPSPSQNWSWGWGRLPVQGEAKNVTCRIFRFSSFRFFTHFSFLLLFF